MGTERKFIKVQKNKDSIIYLMNLGFFMSETCSDIINDTLKIDVEQKKVFGFRNIDKDETVLTYQQLLLTLTSLSSEGVTKKFWTPSQKETGNYEKNSEEFKKICREQIAEEKKIILDLIKDSTFPIKTEEIFTKGLSKREYIATSILSGMVGSEHIIRSRAVVEAVKLTDLLLAELRKPAPGPEFIPERENPKFQIDEDDY